MKQRVYLAGPMRGIPFFNFPAFMKAAELLRAEGFEVFNPAEKDVEEYGNDICSSPTGHLKTAEKKGFNLRNALGADLDYICTNADIVALLPGWKHSKGARAEKATADALGLEILYLSKKFLKG